MFSFPDEHSPSSDFHFFRMSFASSDAVFLFYVFNLVDPGVGVSELNLWAYVLHDLTFIYVIII